MFPADVPQQVQLHHLPGSTGHHCTACQVPSSRQHCDTLQNSCTLHHVSYKSWCVQVLKVLAQLLTRLSLALHGSLHQRELRSASGNTKAHPLSEAEQAAEQEGLLPAVNDHSPAAWLVIRSPGLVTKQSPCTRS